MEVRILIYIFCIQLCSAQDYNPFPQLSSNSTEFGLWPLFTPLMDVSPACKMESIAFANQVLIESADFIDIMNPDHKKAGPALLKIDSTGRLPQEGMLSDYVSLRICDIAAGFIDCQNPTFQNLEIKIPAGYQFAIGSPIGCLDAGGKHCLAMYLTPSTKESMVKETIQESPRIQQIYEYVKKSPILKGIIAENKDFVDALIADGAINVTTSPQQDMIMQIVKYLVTMWAMIHLQYQRPVGLGQCVPQSCQYNEIGSNLNAFFEITNFNSIDIDPSVENERYFCVDNLKEMEWTNLDTFIATVFCAIAVCLVLGTLLDVISIIFSPPKEKKSQSLGMKMLLSFSIYTNFRSIISTADSGKDSLTCLHGMRFLSMSWVVLGHNFLFATNALNAGNVTWPFKVYTGAFGIAFEAIAHAEPSVDSFFLFSGLLVSFLTFKELDRTDGRIKLVMFYVHRYIRLTIPLALVTAFYILVLPAISYSAQQQSMLGMALNQKEGCTNYGWANLVYINNFIEHGNDCIAVTWYTCCDMIFFWISLLVIYPMWSNSVSGGLTWWFLWLIGSTFPPVYETWTFKLGRDGAKADSDENFVKGYGHLPGLYREPWSRFQPYLIGLLLGYILHYTKNKKIHIPKAINALGWQAAFLSAFAVVYGLYSEKTNGPLTNLEYTMFNGFARLGWAVSLAWVIFSCSKGYGGMIHDFLSWKFFLPLSRLSFTTYLVHSVVIYLADNYFKMFMVDLSLTLLVALYLSNLLVAMALALVLNLALESPVIRLEKLIIGALMTGSATDDMNKKKPV